MNAKDIASIAISVAALSISIFSFASTIRQRRIDNERTLRNSLTDVIAEITQIDLERSKLDRENPGMKDDSVVAMRRILNTKKNYLARHGDFISQQMNRLVTDIDFNVLAKAFADIGDHEKAASFWRRCIERSQANVIRKKNLRGYAMFLFRIGEFDMGRRLFMDALEISLPDNDEMRRMKADTYAIWMRSELEYGFTNQCMQLRENAIAYANRIGAEAKRSEFIEYINSLYSPAIQ